jgi:formylglycine-generating enzyme required for sulfatase activity
MASQPAPPLLGPFAVVPERPPFTTARSATVRLSAPDVIHIPAGEFWMGSNQDDIDRAQALCERDAGVSAVLQWSCARAFPPVEAARAIGSPCERAGIHQLTLAERGRHRVLLGPFAIDRTEVTVLAYDRCVEAGACVRSPFARASAAFRGDDQPMVAVSWYEARAYCQWVRGRLPTEAEWERVARGREGRVFPWGNLFNPRLANVGQASPSCRSAVDGFEFTAPVGSFVDGASPDGALDMAGNVAEWVDDFFDDGPTRSPGGPSEWERSPSRYPENTQRVSPRLTSASQNLPVFRGGSFVQGPMFARTTHRARLAASERREWLGFRCAYDGG